jgi:hypothetical protein
MEVPIYLAIDTTLNWMRSDTVLGNSELAIEIAQKENGEFIFGKDGKPQKYLLMGDGKPVGPDVERLRAKPEFIAELSGIINSLTSADEQLQASIRQTEQKLLTNINQMERRLQAQAASKLDKVFHDDTLSGDGIPNNPLSVKIKYDLAVAGLVASAEFTANGKDKTFPLPENFIYVRILLVGINGLGQKAGSDYSLDLDARTITFFETPEDGDVISLAHTAKE